MERHWAGLKGGDDRPIVPLDDERLLPSRAAALKTLRAALTAQAGPLLVTGAAGVGKTWLCRRLLAELPASWRGAAVDLTPATDPAELYRLIGHALGLPGAGGSGASRLGLADALEEGAADGARWVLMVDEAQNAPRAVWEEVRVLGNRLGRPDGFAGLILVGQTPLARRLATRPLTAVDVRLSARVHLRPLDLDEAATFLTRLAPALAREAGALERAHRDTGGNPRRLLQLASLLAPDPRPGRTPRAGATRPALDPSFDAPAPPSPTGTDPAPAPAREAPILGPSRPPIEVSDGVVEVGWDPSAASGPAAEPEAVLEADPPAPEVPVESRGTAPETEEIITDHYAALQAWTEWARNQGRGPEVPAIATDLTASPPYEREAVAESRAGALEAPGRPNVWAEGQQGFAPYSQLFSRLKQAKDPL